MANVTINIKNCGCCGGTKTTGDEDRPPFNEPGDPNSPGGPPEGFSFPTSGLSDRQCKMAVWLYDWLETMVDTLGNTTIGGHALTLAKLAISGAILRVIASGLAGVIGFVIGLVITPGLDPGDAVIGIVSTAVAWSILTGLTAASTAYLTQPAYKSALPIIQTNKSEIICQLAQAESATQAQQRLESVLAEEFDPAQYVTILSFVPDTLLTMLFFSADWWPSFDDDYLAGITTTCCGGAINDTPITPGSAESCQASYYIVQQLAATMEAVADTSGIWYNWNPFDNDRPEIYEWLENNLATPRKIRDRAFSYSSFLNSVTEITYSKFFLNVHFADLSEFQDFADYINGDVATLTAALQAANDTTEAYTALQPLRDWITTNIAPNDSVVADYMQDALDALIKVPDGRPGILDLLLLQDADLAFYELAECDGGGLPCGIFVNSGSIQSEVGGVYTMQSQESGGLHYVNVRLNAIDYGTSCGPLQTVELTNPNGVVNATNHTYRISSDLNTSPGCTGWDLYCDQTLPVGQYCARGVLVTSGSPFTIDLTVLGDC